MSQPFDASRSLTSLEQDSTIIAVIEMSQAMVVPGVERQPLKRLDADEAALLKLLHRWRNEAGQAGREIKRIVVAYEAGRDGFWLARWLRVRGVECSPRSSPSPISYPRSAGVGGWAGSWSHRPATLSMAAPRPGDHERAAQGNPVLPLLHGPPHPLNGPLLARFDHSHPRAVSLIDKRVGAKFVTNFRNEKVSGR
jgi:hypothetical protein